VALSGVKSNDRRQQQKAKKVLKLRSTQPINKLHTLGHSDMVNEINSLTHSSISTSSKKSERVDTVSAENQQQATPQNEVAKETIEISSQAQLLGKLEAQIKDLPEVDQSRVDALRDQINQGTYEIDSSSLAQRIIDLEL